MRETLFLFVEDGDVELEIAQPNMENDNSALGAVLHYFDSDLWMEFIRVVPDALLL